MIRSSFQHLSSFRLLAFNLGKICKSIEIEEQFRSLVSVICLIIYLNFWNCILFRCIPPTPLPPLKTKKKWIDKY